MKEQFEMFAAYNRWANGVVYAAARELDTEELNRNQGAFFGSLIGTLNHILTADRIWMKRFTGSGDAPNALTTVLHPELDALETARRAEDERIVAWIGGVAEETLAANFSYSPISNPQAVTQRLGSAVWHFFNHQTHHRGQCHMILTSLGHQGPVLDLVWFQRTYDNGRYL